MNYYMEKLPLYPNRICIIEGNDQKEIEKFIKLKWTDYNLGEKYVAIAFQGSWLIKGTYFKCIYLVFDKEDEYFNEGVIGHECLHACKYVWEHIDHKVNNENSEPENYLLEYLINLCHQKLNLWKKRESLRSSKVIKKITKELVTKARKRNEKSSN